MSSSYRLQQRRNDQVWNLDNFGITSELDMYVKVNGECLTGFKAYPIARPTGPKLCVRQEEQEKFPQPPSQVSRKTTTSKREASYGNVDLYNTRAIEPRQVSDPRSFDERRKFYPEELVRKDYVQTPNLYDGLGFYEKSKQSPFFRSNYDYLQNAPPKYDVTQMTDRNAIWKSREAQRTMNGIVSVDSSSSDDIPVV
jgi:hypothetical protein